MTIKTIEGGVCAAKGWSAGGCYCAIKNNPKQKNDLALIVSEVPAAVGAVFTTNKFAAAPVQYDKEILKKGVIKAVVANSGNANACCGEQGFADAAKMAELAAAELGVTAEEIMVSSTGVIGVNLPMDRVAEGMPKVKAALDATAEGSTAAAYAIATTDTYIKQAAVEYEYEGKTIHVGGIAKGSGMIHPNMATMLCYITTDLAITTELLQTATKEAADDSFNMITVDGDTSTNDSMLVMANGMAENALISADCEGYQLFLKALKEVACTLAKLMAQDGEGATKLLACTVSGAKTKADARVAAKAIIGSSLVKAAFFGEDANWGRIICALGYSGAEFDISGVDLYLKSAGGELQMMKAGSGLKFDEEQALKVLKEKSIDILVQLKDGEAEATAWGCDLSYDYVKINADYRS